MINVMLSELRFKNQNYFRNDLIQKTDKFTHSPRRSKFTYSPRKRKLTNSADATKSFLSS